MKTITLWDVSATSSEEPPGRMHELPLPAEIPVTDNVGSEELGLKTQAVRFIITGVLSGIVDFGLTLLLMQLGMGHTPAKAVGFICGTTTAYLINRRWTFRAPPSTARFIAVVVLYAITFAVQVGLFDVMFRVLPEGILYTFVAYCVAQGTATIINFVVQRAVIFKLE